MNSIRHGKHRIILPLLTACMAGLTGCGDVEVPSVWKDREIRIDGDRGDWQNALTLFDKKQAGIGIMNDAASLYICLITSDSDLARSLAGRGLTLLVDHPDAHGKIGITYPLRTGPGGRPDFARGDRREMPDRNAENGPPPSEFDAGGTDVKISGPGKNDILRTSLLTEKNLDIKTGTDKDMYVYELRVALNNPDVFPFDWENCADIPFKISFSLATQKQQGPPGGMDMDDRSGGPPGGGRGGGRMGGGGGKGPGDGPPGGGGGMGPDQANQGSPSFTLSVKTALARQNEHADESSR